MFKEDYSQVIATQNTDILQCDYTQLNNIINQSNSLGIKCEITKKLLPVIWFPRTKSDLNIPPSLQEKRDENMDSPQFADPEYLKRRTYITEVNKNFKLGEEIKDVNYNEVEQDTWRRAYKALAEYEYIQSNETLQYKYLLEKKCGFKERIPQLKEINELVKITGFQIIPVNGIITSREFINSLALKNFYSTQYIRHHANIHYTPEPDYLHEIIGHAPQFVNPAIAQISQAIGLISLGASIELMEKIAALYWYTIEFGAVKEDGKIKAFGSGIMSSFGELDNFTSDNAKFELFSIDRILSEPVLIQDIQRVYFYSEDLYDTLQKILEFGRLQKASFTPKYNSQTEQIEVNSCIQAKIEI